MTLYKEPLTPAQLHVIRMTSPRCVKCGKDLTRKPAQESKTRLFRIECKNGCQGGCK